MFADVRTSSTLLSRLPFATLLYGAVIAVGTVLGLAACLEHGWGETGTQLFARYTARFSVLVFLVVFVCRPLADLWPTPVTRDLLRRRRQLGLGFALAHGIHLLALLSFLAASGSWFGATDAVPGLTYLFIALMAATSSNGARRRLGRWWKRLHVTGLYVIFATFLAAYGGRVLGGYGEAAAGDVPPGSYAAHAAIFVLLLLALGLRLTAAVTKRRKRAAEAPAV